MSTKELDVPIELQPRGTQSRSKPIRTTYHKKWRIQEVAVREKNFPPFRLQLYVNNNPQSPSILVSSTSPVKDFDYFEISESTIEFAATSNDGFSGPVIVTLHLKILEE
jgi:hypothetical protein